MAMWIVACKTLGRTCWHRILSNGRVGPGLPAKRRVLTIATFDVVVGSVSNFRGTHANSSLYGHARPKGGVSNGWFRGRGGGGLLLSLWVMVWCSEPGKWTRVPAQMETNQNEQRGKISTFVQTDWMTPVLPWTTWQSIYLGGGGD